ncbi:hypothetical protein LSAT2_013648 [Lamellibrachia satsuma]|nr:hypothetical protein LSAT2_013648 [Lamellibrachia satsuma]
MFLFIALLRVVILVTWSDGGTNAENFTKTACDGYLRLHISCPPGTGVRVNSAFYGRLDRTTCPHSSILTTSCSLPGITERVRTMCDDKITCDVVGPFTGPCVGTYKYLKVIYECRHK